MKRSWEEMFWSHVEMIPFCECWIWSGAENGHGYGAFSLNGKPIGAHRVAYEMHFGPIPESDSYHGTVVMHKCDRRNCVRPEHLMIGTQFDNLQDMCIKGRSGRKLTNQQVEMALVEVNKGKTAVSVARDLGVSPQCLHYRLKRLKSQLSTS